MLELRYCTEDKQIGYYFCILFWTKWGLVKLMFRKPSCLGFRDSKLIPKMYLENIGSILKGNNIWSVRMSLRMSWISHPSLMVGNRCEGRRKINVLEGKSLWLLKFYILFSYYRVYELYYSL